MIAGLVPLRRMGGTSVHHIQSGDVYGSANSTSECGAGNIRRLAFAGEGK
jgi:hypothetical protein